MRHLVGTSVTCIVHDECSLRLELLDGLLGFRIAVAVGCRLARIGIPHDFLDEESRIGGADGVGQRVDIAHVNVVIAIVAHEHDGVLPSTGILVGRVGDDLIDHGFGIQFARHGETAHADVRQTACALVGIAARCQSLVVVEHSEEFLADVAIGFTERVFALIAEKVVVGRSVTPFAAEHSVVGGTIAKEQQVARQFFGTLGAVVEHFHIALIGRRIGRTAGELVVDFVGWNDAHAQPIVRFVEGCQSFGLSAQLLRGRNDDGHVNGLMAMQVLIGDVIDVVGRGEGAVLQVGGLRRFGKGQRDEVKPHRTARVRGDGHLVLFLQVVGTEVEDAIGGTSLLVGDECHGDVAKRPAIESHRCRTVDARRKRH